MMTYILIGFAVAPFVIGAIVMAATLAITPFVVYRAFKIAKKVEDRL